MFRELIAAIITAMNEPIHLKPQVTTLNKVTRGSLPADLEDKEIRRLLGFTSNISTIGIENPSQHDSIDPLATPCRFLTCFYNHMTGYCNFITRDDCITAPECMHNKRPN